jgi:hypothetical protein
MPATSLTRVAIAHKKFVVHARESKVMHRLVAVALFLACSVASAQSGISVDLSSWSSFELHDANVPQRTTIRSNDVLADVMNSIERYEIVWVGKGLLLEIRKDKVGGFQKYGQAFCTDNPDWCRVRTLPRTANTCLPPGRD